MITNTANKVVYTGDGTTKEFLVTFPFSATSELKLFLHTIGTEINTPITNNWSYSDVTGKITYPTYPEEGSAITSSQQIVIVRATPQTQEKDHTVRLFTSKDIEDISDKLTKEVQDLQEQVKRSPKYPVHFVGDADATNFIETISGYATAAESAKTDAQAAAGTATTQAGIATNKAEAADASAIKSQKWAEGTDSEVTPLGGEHSSKGWAAIAKQLVDSIGSVLHYKGSVATYADLPATGQELGDMYNITADGSNYVWTGTGWDAISGIVDLSAYRTSASQDEIDSGKFDKTGGTVSGSLTVTNVINAQNDVNIAQNKAISFVGSYMNTYLTMGSASGRVACLRSGSSRDLLDTGDKGAANGVASLDANTKVPATQLPIDGATIINDNGTLKAVSTVGGKSIGEVYYSQSSTAADNLGGLPLFTGETITNADQLYPDFYAWVANHNALQISAADYETALTTYGECPKYVIDTTNKTIRLPKLISYIKAANTTDGIEVDAESNPVADHFHVVSSMNNNNGAFAATNQTVTGKLPNVQEQSGTRGWNGSGSGGGYAGDADTLTGSVITTNSIEAPAKNADIKDALEPQHTTLYPWVCAYNAAVPASTAQASEFQAALSGKADVNLGNIVNTATSAIAHNAMPSLYNDTLTLGASGDTYIAPADGYFVFNKTANNGGQYVELSTAVSITQCHSHQNLDDLCVFLPVSKGTTVTARYNAGGTTNQFSFVYAEGSKWEM